MHTIKKFALIVVLTTVVCTTAYGNWGANRYGVSGGGGSGVELIGNPDLEVDDTGWSVLNSDEITAEGRNTTNPISGIADYKLSVTSAGTSPTNPIIEVNYTGATILLNKSWEICFVYKVNSGTCILEAVKNGGNGTRKVVSETLTGVGTFATTVNSDDPDDAGGLLFQQLQFDGRNEFEIQIDNISMKLISSAQGADGFGISKFGAGRWGSGGEGIITYWATSTTDYWNVDNTALWNTTTDTEVP